MFQIAPQVVIRASTAVIRDHLVELESWWLGKAHRSTARSAVEDDILVCVTEREAPRSSGPSPHAGGDPSLAWRSAERECRLSGLPIPITKGVSWEMRSVAGGTQLSAYVWARFPRSLAGRFIEWCFTRLERRRIDEHVSGELRHIKERAEGSGSLRRSDVT